MKKLVRVDVYSDVICPWCLIGYHRLQSALSLVDDIDVALTWLPFELNTDMPSAGMDRRAYLEAKFGRRGADDVYGRIAHVMAEEGLNVNLDKITRTPNTFDAHRLLYLARATGRANALKLALFQAYFADGVDIGERAALLNCAESVGLDHAQTNHWLNANAGEQEVRELEEKARHLGVTGVPFLIFEGKLAVSGAQPPEILGQALRQASSLAA